MRRVRDLCVPSHGWCSTCGKDCSAVRCWMPYNWRSPHGHCRVAKDVCEILELDKSSGARGLASDEKGLHTMQTLGGEQKIQILSEPGLYRLIFRSRKKEAENFKRWVCHVVLPSIRKTGACVSPNISMDQMGILVKKLIAPKASLRVSGAWPVTPAGICPSGQLWQYVDALLWRSRGRLHRKASAPAFLHRSASISPAWLPLPPVHGC